MFTFIILTRDHPEYLERCLDSLKNQTWAVWNAIVIDTSNDENIKKNEYIISKYNGIVQHWPYSIEIGFAAKNNMGIAEALKDKWCKFICLLNDDAFPNPYFVQNMIDHAARYTEYSIFSPLFCYNSKKIQVAGGGYFTEDAPCGENQLLHDVEPSKLSGEALEEVKNIVTTPRGIDCGYGAAIVYRREVFGIVGMLDEEFKHGFDEPDFAKRAAKKGIKCLYVPTWVEHICGGSSNKQWYKNLHVVLPMTYGYFRFLLKHYDLKFALRKEKERLITVVFKPKSLVLELYSVVWNIYNFMDTRSEYGAIYN